LEFDSKPSLQRKPKVDLCDGLYTDDRLVNYLEAERKKGRWVIRILSPNAEPFLDLPDEQIEKRCKEVLERLELKVMPGVVLSIRRWELGLPCGGSSNKYERVSGRIYLCGDRYGRWPSMAAAIVSGATSADALVADLEVNSHARPP
jgi:hypothetical protein